MVRMDVYRKQAMMVNRIQNLDRLPETLNDSNKIFQSDEFLWSRYLATNDRRLFDQLVHRYEDEIFRHLFRLLRNAQWAEDARQGTFLKMHLKRNQFHPGRPLKPWLYAIATHEAIDLQRKNNRHRMQSLDQSQAKDKQAPHNLIHRVESTVSPPGQNLEREEIRAHVRRSVNNLPPSLRQPVELVYYRGLKIREAADRIGIPHGTVKSRMRKAIGLLNRSLKDFNAFIPDLQQDHLTDKDRPNAPDASSNAEAKPRFRIHCGKQYVAKVKQA